MTVTYQELKDYVAIANAYLNQESEAKKTSKLGYAIKKVNGKLEKIFKAQSEKEEDKRIEYAATSDDGLVLLNDKGGYQFKKDDYKTLVAELRKINNETVNLEEIVYYATEIPKDIDLAFVDRFKGFVINPEWVNSDGELLCYSAEEFEGKNKKK